MKALLIIIYSVSHLSFAPTISLQEFPSMKVCENMAKVVKERVKWHRLDSRLDITIDCEEIK